MWLFLLLIFINGIIFYYTLVKEYDLGAIICYTINFIFLALGICHLIFTWRTPCDLLNQNDTIYCPVELIENTGNSIVFGEVNTDNPVCYIINKIAYWPDDIPYLLSVDSTNGQVMAVWGLYE